MIRILITGANGCVGSALVKYLAKTGYQVTALARDIMGINNISPVDGIEIACSDIRDTKKIDDILSAGQFAVIVHLAAIVHESDAVAGEYDAINYHAAVTLFELGKKHHIKQFVFISTVAVYGQATRHIYDEETACNPHGKYALAKWKAEEYIKCNCNPDISFTIIRPATVYGGNDKGNIARLFRIAQRGIVPIIGDGNNLKSFVFVENLIGGITSALLNASAYNQIFILSDDKPYSVNEIIAEMRKVIGRKIIVLHFPLKITIAAMKIINFFSVVLFKKQFLNPSSVIGLFTNNTFDISKAKKILGYAPKYTLSTGLNKAYRTNNQKIV